MRVLLLLLLTLGSLADAIAAQRPNVIFIAIDDLRPELGCYGSEIAVTPNLDAIADNGLLFNRAYCQQAICSPSRASLMTGARPDTIGVTENYTYFRDLNPDIVTLPQHFRANGYETVNCGKIYHGKFNDLEKSWSRQPAMNLMPKGLPKPIGVGGYALEENRKLVAAKKKKFGSKAHSALLKGPAYEAADVPDQMFEDGYNTDLAIVTIKDMINKNSGKPFFMGLGFKKPHLNFVAPKKYWDLYDPNDLPAGTYTDAPLNGAAMGLHASFELRTRHGIPKYGPIGPELSKTLLHGYLACTSYVDAQIGRMIAALDEAGVRENTIIVIWGDHGWHLGDMGVWGKATNYEIAARVPLMIWTPDMPDKNRGAKTDALVELVDMYPTLCELAGLRLPSHLEGHSFAPLLQDPDQRWKTAAFSQYPNPALREWAANPITPDMRKLFFGPLIDDVEAAIIKQQGEEWDRELFEKDLMGYSMKTDGHRLVVWKDVKKSASEPVYVELYDHQNDPTESKNVAQQNPDQVKKLMAVFESGWQGNLPPAKDGVLVFEDHFERDESQDQKDEPGNDWTTSSGKTAGGNKQVDLRDGAMHIYTHATANHATSVRHAFEFENGTVVMRFKLHRKGDSLKLNFADMACKSVHAGHLFNAIISETKVTLSDLKTGVMDKEIRTARASKKLSPAQKTALKGKQKSFPLVLELNQWHEVKVHVDGPKVTTEIDGTQIGSFESDGFAHPTKSLLRLLVGQTATVDDVRIWRKDN